MPTAMGRRLRDEQDARACLHKAERSGLGRRAWAHANGVNARSLNAWRLILGRRESPSLRLVELLASDAPRVQARYAVCVGELRIEVDPHFDPEVLRLLIATVASC
jgi:hypothetical protein